MNSWLGGMKLLIDGEQRVMNNDLLALDKNRPLLTTDLDGSKVEVFVKALGTVQVKICVDGRQVGGVAL